MIIIGCDYHPGFQQIAFVDTDSGEWNERKLGHREEAEQVYRQLKVRGKKAAPRRPGHGPAQAATTWQRTRTVRGNTPETSSATTSTAKPDLNEWVRAA